MQKDVTWHAFAVNFNSISNRSVKILVFFDGKSTRNQIVSVNRGCLCNVVVSATYL